MKCVHRTIVVFAAALFACSKEAAPPVVQGGGAATESPSAAPAPSPTPAPIDATSPVGSWTLDTNASLDVNVAALIANAESITPEQESNVRNQVALIVALLQMDLTLAADGSLSGKTTAPSIGGTASAPAPLTGTWSLESDVLRVTTRPVGAVDAETFTGRFEGGKLVLRMEQGDAPPMALIFVRTR